MWSGTQENYSTIKKEILAIVLCIQKFQEYVFNKKNFFFMLIAKVQKKFFKKMFKILFQSRYFLNGKRSCHFLILKLNLSKVIQTLFLIFLSREFLQGKWALKSPNPVQKPQKPSMQCLQSNKKSPILKPKIDSKFLKTFFQTSPNQHLLKRHLQVKTSNIWLRPMWWRYRFLNLFIFQTLKN